MTRFHRFFTLFPLILLIFALSACGGTGQRGGIPGPGAHSDGGMADQGYGAPVSGRSGDEKQDGSVRAALLLPLSGPQAGLGQALLQAAQLAVFDLGYDSFELLPRDTGGTSSGAARAAQTAMDEGADIILGPLFADEVRAVKSATAGQNINVIAFSTDWTLAGGNTYLMGFMPFEQVARIADFAAARGIKTTAVAATPDTYGRTTSSAFEARARENGLMISRVLSEPSGYQAVFVPVGGADLAPTLARIGNLNAQKLGTGVWDDPRIAAIPDLEGAWFAAPSPRSRSGFEGRYEKTFGARPPRIASLAYDSTALAAALARAGYQQIGEPAFDAASLKNPAGFAGVDGIIRFNDRNVAERGMAVLEIRNGRIQEIDPAPTRF